MYVHIFTRLCWTREHRSSYDDEYTHSSMHQSKDWYTCRLGAIIQAGRIILSSLSSPEITTVTHRTHAEI